jgi:hypothetical protein
MAYSKVRWISTPAFLACVGGTHGKGEGTNVSEGARTAEGGVHFLGAVCAPYAGVCARSNPDHPTWQLCGSHRGQSKPRFTCPRSTRRWPLSDRHEPYRMWRTRRTHAQTTLLSKRHVWIHSSSKIWMSQPLEVDICTIRVDLLIYI